MFKTFPEVFSELKLDNEINNLLKETLVTKVSTNRERNFLRVYIKSNHIIEKKVLYQLENQLNKQLFHGSYKEISIIDSYELSSQYNLSNLYPEYLESMHIELKRRNGLLYSVLETAKCNFIDKDTMEITLKGNAIARQLEDELMLYFNKVFSERFAIENKIIIHYETVDYTIYDLEKEQQIKNRANAILKQSSLSADSETVEADVTKLNNTENNETRVKESNKNTNKIDNKTDTKEEGKKLRPLIQSNNKDVIYGRDFEDDSTEINQIVDEIGEVTIRGMVTSIDTRDIRNEKTILIFTITDFTDTISVKMFLNTEQVPELLSSLKKDNFYRIKGIVITDKYDHELCLQNINGIKKSQDFRKKREDTAVKKRVELHCHTKMSDSDGVTDASTLVSRAVSWGHQAIAITDHGNVQAFPDAFHTIQRFKDSGTKVIYGLEGYLVDDTKGIVTNSKGQYLSDTYVVFDIETTGLSALKDKIIEIGAVKVTDGKITDRFSTFINPEIPIPFRIEELTSINDSMVMDADTIDLVLPRFIDFIGDAALVAHNAEFDVGFISYNCEQLNIPCDFTVIDTIAMARWQIPSIGKYTLDHVAKTLKIDLMHHHRAVDDAECTALIFIKLIEQLKKQEIYTLDDANEAAIGNEETVRKLPQYHIILLAKNEIGRVNLYRLVSASHLHYFYHYPKIPKSLIEKYREGLIIGSACEAGELFQAIIRKKSDREIANIVSFYDYLEIQPISNNEFMLRGDKRLFDSEADLQELNKTVVKLGEKFNKPVCATCDVHHIDPEDEIYRRIILVGKGMEDEPSKLYFRTTEEMMAEFEYLGHAKAEEVVITNTNLIADMCEYIEPVRPDKCPPVIPNSDEMLRTICYNKAHSMYGDPLPPVVEERLERELKSIIGNGFAVMYIIAQKLVWKSNEDGYLVGSRGSVGSSFVATMAGITEVNPLAPHYYCDECHFSDFDSEEVKKYAGMAGVDMPDRVCPNCGKKLVKAGFDIPFETFLGFKGDKEPDIDLNFSGDYQSKAHKYTEVIFGDGQTFRAGTIGTLAEKTAFGLVKKYYEEKGIHKREAEINRILSGCVGVRRTTGQHPGGIIVLPLGEDINSFTPVQHPANDMTTDIVTTHFDYHSIDHNLLKLDILGHDDPTMIRFLEDLTGVDALSIPLDDPKVMSLFQSTEALGVSTEDLDGVPLGSLGIPEFGTNFVIQMLMDTKPQCFSDLIRISGLSHGTDVWLGNAQTLITEGKCTISSAICTRDDIMTYLIGMGVEPEESFKIMENVRKGKVAGKKCKEWDEKWKQDLKDHNVPDWYIWSCEKIQYMFPKAHAAAYVMMAWRIAYFKIYYPQAYYAAYFSIRASAFNFELMCQGMDRLKFHMSQLKSLEKPTPKDEDTLKDMQNVLEMYARGYEFAKIDIYQADARRCKIIDGKIMPPLTSISGFGGIAADVLVEEAKKQPFLSKDDLHKRGKVPTNVLDIMSEFGIIDLPETNQLSIFDFA